MTIPTPKKPPHGRRSKLQKSESEERALYYKAQTERINIEMAKTRGELVSPSILEYALAKISQEIAAALSALPSQIKVEIPHLRAAEVRLIEARLARVRNSLANTTLDFKDAT